MAGGVFHLGASSSPSLLCRYYLCSLLFTPALHERDGWILPACLVRQLLQSAHSESMKVWLRWIAGCDHAAGFGCFSKWPNTYTQYRH